MSIVRALICVTLVPAALWGQRRGVTARDSDGIQIVTVAADAPTTLRRLEPGPALTIGSADGSAEKQFGQIVGAVRLAGGQIVVADTKNYQLRVFDSGGVFVRAIGQRGEGPGDYEGMWALFHLPGDTLLVWDMRTHRLTWVMSDGKVRRTLAVDHPPSMADPSGRGSTGFELFSIGPTLHGGMLGYRGSFRYNPPTGLYSDSFFVSSVDASGKLTPMVALLKDHSYVHESSHNKMVTFDNQPFTTTASMATNGQSLWYTDGAHWELAQYDMHGALRRLVRVQRPLAPVTGADIARFKAAAIEADKTEKLRDESSRQQVIDADREALDWVRYPATMPAYDDVVIAANGDIWARQYGDSTAAQRWAVFDGSGRLVATSTLPAGISVMEIGHDYVLGRFRDADDVGSVRLYRFVR